jgi:hypothetical protein
VRRLTASGFAAAMALMASTAWAELNDKPYFNLWTAGTTHGGLTGDGTSIALCGTSACDGAFDKNNYAIFSVVDPNAGAGSGNIDPFLRFQHNEGPATGSNPTEAAYNTNFRSATNPTNVGAITDLPGTPLNQAKDANAFNHVIKLSDLIVDVVNGIEMVTFKLDINEPGGGKETLRLDELALFISDSTTLNNFDVNGPDGFGTFVGTDGNPLSNVVKVWDMDFNNKNEQSGAIGPADLGFNIETGAGISSAATAYGGLNLSNINDSGRAGSGDYDMQMQLSKALFTSALGVLGTTDAYVYLYNFAGEADTCDKNNDPLCSTEAEAGFEEWAAVVSTPPDDGGGGVPEPGTALLVAGGLIGMFQQRRRANKAA